VTHCIRDVTSWKKASQLESFPSIPRSSEEVGRRVEIWRLAPEGEVATNLGAGRRGRQKEVDKVTRSPFTFHLSAERCVWSEFDSTIHGIQLVVSCGEPEAFR
jgi:hypothetical protein